MSALAFQDAADLEESCSLAAGLTACQLSHVGEILLYSFVFPVLPL